MAADEVVGLVLVCLGNKYQSAEIPAFWQSPVYVYPSTVKAGLPQKPPGYRTTYSQVAHFLLEHHVQTERAGEEKKKSVSALAKTLQHISTQ